MVNLPQLFISGYCRDSKKTQGKYPVNTYHRNDETRNVCMFSQLARCCAARGSSTRSSLVGSTKFEACKSFLFTEKFPCIEHLAEFVITFCHDPIC